MKKNIHEIFEEFEQASSRKDKIAVLQKNDSYELRQVLKGSFDPKIEFIIEKVPYYSPSDAPIGLGYTTISQELKRAYLFQKDNPKRDPNLSKERVEVILIQILENLEAKEAVVFMNMLLKKQKVKGLTDKIVQEAFPGLI
jgi:hypothetical protein